MNTELKAIIFDFDGVIHDTFESAYAINLEVMKEANITITKDEYRSFFEGNVLEKVHATFDKNILDNFREKWSIDFQTLQMDEEIKKELRKLKEDYELYIITSNTLQNLNTYFHNNNFTDIFTEILAEETHKSKIEKFKMLFTNYNLTADNCIFVTDTLGDIKEANSVNVKSIACTFGFHGEERLRRGNPFKLISTFREIIPCIESVKLKIY